MKSELVHEESFPLNLTLKNVMKVVVVLISSGADQVIDLVRRKEPKHFIEEE